MFSVNRQVLSFESGVTAWNYLKQSDNADIIISDINMPDMSGFELLSKIKGASPDKTCVLMSADSENEIAARELKADAFLAKPFSINDLFNLVETFVVNGK